MKKWLPILCIMFLLLPLLAPVSAQSVPESEAEAWLQSQNIQLSSSFGSAEVGQDYFLSQSSIDPGCLHRPVNRDPATAGVMTVNSQYIGVSFSYCRDTNSALIDIGSRWWGLSGKTQLITGYLEVLDNFDNVVDFIQITGENDPLLDGALNVPITWQYPTYDVQYQFRLALNHRMLPDNVGPGTLRSSWYLYSPPFTLNLPIVVREESEGCIYQLHVTGQYGVDEYYCFSAQGNAFAMLHFGHSEVVIHEWVDAEHKPLAQLPAGGFCRLTWWDGYKDFTTPAFILQATKWPKDGGPTWLATEHMVNCQYSDPTSGALWRLTVPEIWDP